MKSNLPNIRMYAKDIQFDGSDPIKIIAFLTKYASICDMLHLAEHEAFIALSSFLSGDADKLFTNAVQAATDMPDAVTNWPTAVAYPMKRWARNDDIKSALDDLWSLEQKPSETEEQFYNRFISAHERAGFLGTSSIESLPSSMALIEGIARSSMNSASRVGMTSTCIR